MLALLSVKRITLMTNNPEKVVALEGFGIEVAGQKRLIGAVNPHNQRYLSTKARRAGHILGDVLATRSNRPLGGGDFVQ